MTQIFIETLPPHVNIPTAQYFDDIVIYELFYFGNV